MSKRPPLGQHFLADQQVLAKLVAAINPRATDVFIEVGPGTGVLTVPLLEAGAQVIAIECDRRLAEQLTRRLGKLAQRLEVVVGDAAKQLPQPSAANWRLVGNLPYAISSPLLTGLANRRAGLVDVCVMVQHEFADRLAAQPHSRSYGRLSVVVQARFEVEYLFAVAPQAFAPPPKVTSAVVRLKPLANVPAVVDRAAFETVTRLAFGQRRKRLDNALASLECGVDDELAGLRAENISVADYVRLADRLEAAQR